MHACICTYTCVHTKIHEYSHSEIVLTVLESRQVTISGSRRESVAGAPLQYSIPLNCTVWASLPSYHKVISTVTSTMLICMY